MRPDEQQRLRTCPKGDLWSTSRSPRLKTPDIPLSLAYLVARFVPLGMGSMLSTWKGSGNESVEGGEQASSSHDGRTSGLNTGVGELNELRFADLMHSLQKVARLQREATNAQIDARQKRREAAFKREEIWIWDAKFMGEIQRLSAEGKLAGFEELGRLAALCQSSRDGLGPLEQEGTEAEQHWEGQIWKLRQTEETLISEFSREFSAADAYPPAPSSIASSQYDSSSEQGSNDVEEGTMEGQTVIPYRAAGSVASTSSFPFRNFYIQSPMQPDRSTSHVAILPGLEGIGSRQSGGYNSRDSDSGFGDIDLLDDWSGEGLVGPPQPLPQRIYASIELYPHLLVDFTSRRERINKWLEDMILESHLEATSLFGIVKTQLAAENKIVPSNWSQLVIAYWELDGAAIPRPGHTNREPQATPPCNAGEHHETMKAESSSQNELNRHQSPSPVTPRVLEASKSCNIPELSTPKSNKNIKPAIGSFSMRSGSLVISPPSPPQSHGNSDTEMYDRGRAIGPPP